MVISKADASRPEHNETREHHTHAWIFKIHPTAKVLTLMERQIHVISTRDSHISPASPIRTAMMLLFEINLLSSRFVGALMISVWV
jgi:hypothetical protein